MKRKREHSLDGFNTPHKKPNQELWSTIYSLAQSQDYNSLEKFLNCEGISVDLTNAESETIVEMFAKKRNHEIVHHLIHRFHANRELAVSGYSRLLSDVKEATRLMAMTEDELLREQLADFTTNKNPGLDKDELLRNAAELRYLYQSHTPDNLITTSSDYYLIYHLAKIHDETTLMKAKQLGAKFYGLKNDHLVRGNDLIYEMASGVYPPLILLAKKLETEAVNLLLKLNGGNVESDLMNIFCLICGYAWGGHVSQVEETFLSAKSNKKAKKINKYNQLLMAGYTCYAFGGHLAEAIDLLCKFCERTSPTEYAMRFAYIYQACALGEHFEIVNSYIAQGEDKNGAIWAYSFLLSLKKSSTESLKIIVQIDDEQIIKTILELGVVNKLFTQEESLRLKNTAEQIKTLIKNYRLSFEQSLGFLRKGACGWVLQSSQLAKKSELPLLPKELLILIASYVMELPYEDTKTVIKAIYLKIAIDTSKASNDLIDNCFYGRFFTSEEYLAKKELIRKQFHDRLSSYELDWADQPSFSLMQ